MKKVIVILFALIVVGAAYYAVKTYKEASLRDNAKFVSGNGRLEATEVSIAAKLAGRIDEILVDEGDFVELNQHLALMQTNTLKAELAQAKAQREQAAAAESNAQATIDVRIGDLEVAKANVMQQESVFDGARKRFERSKTLNQVNVASRQQYEDDETAFLTAKAELAASKAALKQAEAAVKAARAEAASAAAAILAADANIQRIQADIDDSLLVAPRAGRIQYRIAQPGEVLSAGGRVLNLVDLSDVYMTFFLPEEIAGKVPIGADVRLILDALPDVPIPAKVTYVASVAQFTPKTVETRVERQKLMFRVKAHIDPELLKKYVKYVKTGIPGVAWVRLDPNAEWPERLQRIKDPSKISEIIPPGNEG